MLKQLISIISDPSLSAGRFFGFYFWFSLFPFRIFDKIPFEMHWSFVSAWLSLCCWGLCYFPLEFLNICLLLFDHIFPASLEDTSSISSASLPRTAYLLIPLSLHMNSLLSRSVVHSSYPLFPLLIKWPRFQNKKLHHFTPSDAKRKQSEAISLHPCLSLVGLLLSDLSPLFVSLASLLATSSTRMMERFCCHVGFVWNPSPG